VTNRGNIGIAGQEWREVKYSCKGIATIRET
jgi:hypothetical protein